MALSEDLTYLRKKAKVGVRDKGETSLYVNREDGVSWTFCGHKPNHTPDWAVSIFPAYFCFSTSRWTGTEVLRKSFLFTPDLCWAEAVQKAWNLHLYHSSLMPSSKTLGIIASSWLLTFQLELHFRKDHHFSWISEFVLSVCVCALFWSSLAEQPVVDRKTSFFPPAKLNH